MADPVSFAIAAAVQIGISYLFPAEGPRLKDLKMSASTYGAAIPWVFGLARVPGNMIWSTGLREHKKKKGMGKGGFANVYTYSCTFAMGLCKGPITQVRRVWADGKLIYDIQAVSSKYRMRFYLGDETQVPDSAIVADRGDNAPAFRGLAYILFDDMNLSDFGNRIPQITVEVLVGASDRTVAVTALKEIDNVEPFDATYAQGEATFDWQRAYGYVRKGSALRQVSLKTGRLLYDSSNLGFASGELARLLCTGHDGAIYVSRGADAPVMPVDRLDGFSLQSVASYSVPAPVAAVTARNFTSTEYLLTVAEDGVATLLRALDMTPRWTTALGGTATVDAFRLCGRDADSSEDPAYYVLMRQPGAGALVLSRVKGAITAEVTDVHTITGAAVEPCGALYDSAHPGVILFWRDGAQAYAARWNEDSGEEDWRTPIAGCPDTYSGESNLLGTQLGWVHAGLFYVIDTLSGELVSKDVDPSIGDYVDRNQQQIDWADYLIRYPTVKAQYFVYGWSLTGSPEAFAQYDYQNGGETAGRTLTYVGGAQGGSLGQGEGFQLTGNYDGLSALYQAYDSTTQTLVCLDGIEALVSLNDTAAGVSVGTIVSRLLREGGLPASMTRLTPLYDMPIRGYGWASGTDIKGILDELRKLFLFDLVERDGMLVAIARADPTNGVPVAAEIIHQGALGSTGDDVMDFWQETRLQEADLPAAVTLAYMNIEADFETSTARSQRIGNPIPTMYSRQQVAMEINIVLTPAEAKTQVNRILYSQWLERTKHNTRMPWAYLNLDPADVFEVHMDDGRIYQDRLNLVEIGADFVMATESYSADQGAYDAPIGDSDGGSGGGGQTVSQPGLAVPFIINTPLLRDQDDQGGGVSVYYLGAGNAASAAFQGAGIYRSTNNVDFDLMQGAENETEWGVIYGVVPPPASGDFALDWKTRITIQPSVDWFEIESITDAELWEGANVCLVGQEVIQFRDTVQNADGTWTIWNLLRGRRGTEYACDTHRAGERFVFLSNATITLASDLTSSRGQPRYFRAVASGRTLQETATLQIAYEPRDLMPYAVNDIRIDRTPTPDVKVTWARRTRMGGNMQDGTGSVPLGEKFERYEAYILAAPFAGDLSKGEGPTTFLRKYAALTTPTFTYTAAEQAADTFDPTADTLHLVIYQLSDPVGRGFPAVRSIQASDIF